MTRNSLVCTTTHFLLHRLLLGAILAGVLVQEIGNQLTAFVRMRNLRWLTINPNDGLSINLHL